MLPRLKSWIGLKEIVVAAFFWRRDSVSEFEQSFASISKQKYAVAFPYGRTGLFCLIKALKLEGREVICPAYTCVVVPHAIVTAGATPVFVDSKENDFNMDWELVEKAVTENTGAVVATSIFGSPISTEDVANFRRRWPRILILQDCAHSFFAGEEGKEVNLAGDAAFFGFNISKIMTSIFGGMVTTDDVNLARELNMARDSLITPPSLKKSIFRFLYLSAVWIAFNRVIYGCVNWLERMGVLDRFVKYFDESVITMPSDFTEGMTGVEARVGIVQCEKYTDIVNHRRKIAEVYHRCLCKVPGLQLPTQISSHTFSHYVIKTDRAEEIINELAAKGFQIGELIDYFIPNMKSYQETVFWGKGIAAEWPGRVINLPVHNGCKVEDAEIICEIIERIINCSHVDK